MHATKAFPRRQVVLIPIYLLDPRVIKKCTVRLSPSSRDGLTRRDDAINFPFGGLGHLEKDYGTSGHDSIYDEREEDHYEY